MPKQIYDVIVIGTGAGGGMAIHTLCKAGAKVCALNGSRRLNPSKVFATTGCPTICHFAGSATPRSAASGSGTWITSTRKASGNTTLCSRQHPAPNGHGGAASRWAGRLISGAGLLRASPISTSGRLAVTGTTLTGLLLIKSLHLTTAAWNARSESRAQCRIVRAIRMATICRR